MKPGIILMMIIQPGLFGKYDLHERLGRGGMAEVWKAFDPRLQRNVAIKFLQATV
jgi:serine/threonine protein kinase